MRDPELPLLLPHATCPAHMLVSDDWRVLEQLQVPYTLVSWVPNWSNSVLSALADIAAGPRPALQNHNRVYSRDDNGTFSSAAVAGYVGQSLRLILPAIPRDAVEEIVDGHVRFAAAFDRVKGVSVPGLLLSCQPEEAMAGYALNYDPMQSNVKAHTDIGPQGVFSYAAGSVVIDQTNWQPQGISYSMQRATAYVPMTEVKPEQLWQTAPGAFTIWTGGIGATAQFHLMPKPNAKVQRLRTILFA